MSQLLEKTLVEMATTLKERAGIQAQEWGRDAAVFVATHEGIVAAIDNELHLGSASEMVVSLLGPDGIPMEEGDTVVANDPYLGSPHLQDFYILTPVHYQGGVIAYLGAKAHLPDVGGDIARGFNLWAQEIWAEGVRITPLRICRGSRLDTSSLNTILLNSRTSDPVRVGLESMIAAVGTGRKEILGLACRGGSPENFIKEMEKVILDTESRFREVVGRWSSGEYLGDCLVDDERVREEGLKVETKFLVKDTEIEIDFSTSQPQLRAPFNSPRGNTLSFALLPFLPLLSAGIFINGGILRVITVKTKKGTLVDPVLPAPTSFSPFHVGQEISSSVRAAMEKFLPQDEKDRLARKLPWLVNWHPRGQRS